MDFTNRHDDELNRRRQVTSESPYEPDRPASQGYAAPGGVPPAFNQDSNSWYSRPITNSSQGGIDYTQALGLDPPLAPFPPSGGPAGYGSPRRQLYDDDHRLSEGQPEVGGLPQGKFRRSPSRESLTSSTTGDVLNFSTEGRASPALSVASSSGYRSFQDPGHGAPRSSSPYQSTPKPSTSYSQQPGFTPVSGYSGNLPHEDNRTETPGLGSSRATPIHSFRPVTPTHHQQAAPPAKKGENMDPMTGVAVGFASLFAENFLSHPCTVLRRQCQVHHRSRQYHLTPFALVKVVMNLQRYQGFSTFWKGIGSTFIVKGMFLVSEHVISEVTPFRRDVTPEGSTLKQLGGHVALKGISHLLVTPFFSAALVESVQSDIASERPGIFDCVREGSYRLVGYGMPQTTRLFPVWQLIFPTAIHGTFHYVISAISQWAVVKMVKYKETVSNRNLDEVVFVPSPRYPLQTDVLPSQPKTELQSSTAAMVQTYYIEVIGSFAGHFLADVLLYPLETILHRLHLQGTRTIVDDLDSGLSVLPITTRYEGVFDCYRCIVKEEGRIGLFKGFGALILQYTIHLAIIRLTKLLLDQISELSRGSGKKDAIHVQTEHQRRNEL